MYFPAANDFNLTKDGVQLNNIFVERAKFNTKLSSTKKQFKPDMLVPDLADVDIDNLRSNTQNLHFEILDNQIVALDGKDAYRFAFRYQTDEGLKKRGIIYGVNYAGFLYRIVYVAAEQHYFDLNEKAFEGFIQSFRFL